MSALSPETVALQHLAGLDEDLITYITSILDDMTVEERKSSDLLNESISPFLIDSGFVDSEEAANACCKRMSVAFGGSGYKSQKAVEEDQTPMLLYAPMKMKDTSGYEKQKHTYGGVVLAKLAGDDDKVVGGGGGGNGGGNSNSALDASAMPTTQKQVRQMRRENERVQKIMRIEASARQAEEAELSRARLAAIKASRLLGRQSVTGVNIERFSIPHPSGTSDLLTDVSLVLAPGRRYGMIGKNGAGKTTLMKTMAHYKLEGLQHLRILLVDQHVEGDDESALQWVLRADVERTSLLEDEQRLIHYLHGGGTDDQEKEIDEKRKNDSNRKKAVEYPSELPADLKGVNLEVALAECYDRMSIIGVDQAETKARKILEGLGFSVESMTNPTASLSGGWAMRAALAAALYVCPNLLLLDEPTNHLDLHALVWLENWLNSSFQGICVIVSHDVVFLNSVCTDILELRSTLAGQAKSSLTHYSGDYYTYENTVQENRKAQMRAREAYDKEKEKLREFISREGKKYDTPSHQNQRRMKLRQLEQLMEVEKVEEESEVVLRFPKPNGNFPRSETIISCQDCSFAWPGSEAEPLFDSLEMCIPAGARLAILGKNGCGKTSLLNLLMGESEPLTGQVTRNFGVRITMLQQHHYKGEQLEPNLSALEHMRRLPQEASTAVGLLDPGTRAEETAQRSYLSNFGISGPRTTIPVKLLSGGQRMRVAMAVALYKKPDVLILDEPTNHLDTETVDALCNALQSYEGTIIAVSHDEAFVTRVISKAATTDKDAVAAGSSDIGELWVMTKRKLRKFDGTFKEYKNKVMSGVLLGNFDV